VITCEPGRVTVRVWPLALTVMLAPKTKVAVVCVGPMLTIMMPPRMPSVAAGVVMVIALVLLILPPTRRNTPLLALIARSPVLVSGSNTNLSMVSCAFGPTVSDVPSMKTRWARSLALVVMTSFACRSMPTRSTRPGSLGGLPSGSPSVAEVTPTRAAVAGRTKAEGDPKVSDDRARRNRSVLHANSPRCQHI
jgi:hypothetical protein